MIIYIVKWVWSMQLIKDITKSLMFIIIVNYHASLFNDESCFDCRENVTETCLNDLDVISFINNTVFWYNTNYMEDPILFHNMSVLLLKQRYDYNYWNYFTNFNNYLNTNNITNINIYFNTNNHSNFFIYLKLTTSLTTSSTTSPTTSSTTSPTSSTTSPTTVKQLINNFTYYFINNFTYNFT